MMCLTYGCVVRLSYERIIVLCIDLQYRGTLGVQSMDIEETSQAKEQHGQLH